MAKGLDGMIRLQKWQLDEKRRQMSDLENMKEELLQKKKKLGDDLIQEQQNLSNATVVNINYASYAVTVIARQETLDKSIEEIDVSIEEMKDQLTEAFIELKKFETVDLRNKERERAKRARREQIELDEISSTMHRRNRKQA